MSGCLRGEQDFLDLIDEVFARTGPGVVLGRGDDCAVIAASGPLCLSTDLFLEDVHFRRAYFPPADIGYKALAVNVSDVAAMGASPLGFSLGLTVPPGLDRGYVRELLSGMAGLARETGCVLTGGDLSGGERLGLCLTIWGTAAGPRFLTRGRVRPGDVLFVHAAWPGGDRPLAGLGLARAGLAVLEDRWAGTGSPAGAGGSGDGDSGRFARAVAAHLRPPVRLGAARLLARTGLGAALMDVSDGLAADLPRLLAGADPGQGAPDFARGAELTLDPGLLDPDFLDWCAFSGRDPAEEAYAGGEDYALLGAVAPGDWPSLRRAVPGVARLGTAVRGTGLVLNGRPAPSGGFDHFSPK